MYPCTCAPSTSQKIRSPLCTMNHMDKDIFCKVFKGLVRPHVEYANQIWAPHLKKHIVAIENVQRRATKLIPGFYDMPYTERLKQLNLPTLAYRRLRGDMVEVFKLVNPEVGYDKTLTPLLPINERRSRGNKYKLYHRRARKDIRKYPFGYLLDTYLIPTSPVPRGPKWSFAKSRVYQKSVCRLFLRWKGPFILSNFFYGRA